MSAKSEPLFAAWILNGSSIDGGKYFFEINTDAKTWSGYGERMSGNTSQKKNRFLSGIAQITSP